MFIQLNLAKSSSLITNKPQKSPKIKKFPRKIPKNFARRLVGRGSSGS